MADVELVVKMPEEVYKSIINGKNYISYQEYVEEAIKNGTPLPKGHGELKDAKAFLASINRNRYDTYNDFSNTFDWIMDAETLIEADKENENDV